MQRFVRKHALKLDEGKVFVLMVWIITIFHDFWNLWLCTNVHKQREEKSTPIVQNISALLGTSQNQFKFKLEAL